MMIEIGEEVSQYEGLSLGFFGWAGRKGKVAFVNGQEWVID